MILTAMIGYYVFAVGVLALIGYAVGLQNAKQLKMRADEMIATIQRFRLPDRIEDPTVGPGREVVPTITEPLQEKVSALILTLRVVPGASEDVLASMTSLLLARLSRREEEMGGEGLEFDLNGSRFASDRVLLRLFPVKREGAVERVARLVEELNSEGKRVTNHTHLEADIGIGAKIIRNLKSPLPESAMKQLETAAVG